MSAGRNHLQKSKRPKLPDSGRARQRQRKRMSCRTRQTLCSTHPYSRPCTAAQMKMQSRHLAPSNHAPLQGRQAGQAPRHHPSHPPQQPSHRDTPRRRQYLMPPWPRRWVAHDTRRNHGREIVQVVQVGNTLESPSLRLGGSLRHNEYPAHSSGGMNYGSSRPQDHHPQIRIRRGIYCCRFDYHRQ